MKENSAGSWLVARFHGLRRGFGRLADKSFHSLKHRFRLERGGNCNIQHTHNSARQTFYSPSPFVIALFRKSLQTGIFSFPLNIIIHSSKALAHIHKCFRIFSKRLVNHKIFTNKRKLNSLYIYRQLSGGKLNAG